ncbi:MAG: hypothetical protein M1833_004338 [Piccolia ochrophora]|nr:MAG: hypothetical protein M1833_004338 [Piccolia ochrophora]
MSSKEVKSYVLGRNADETERLNFQHDIWTANIGYLLNPSIDPSSKPDFRIADVGTGTGILLLDLAKEVPQTCHLDGFDVSADQFPSQASLPRNVAFHEQDLMKPFPEEFRGHFDAVSLRLVAVAIDAKDLETAVGNVVSLLKPGGHIQWTEADWTRMTAVQTHPSTSTATLTSALRVFNDFLVSASKAINHCYELVPLFEKLGLVDCDRDVLSSDRKPETRRAFTQSAIGAVFGGLERIAQGGYIEWSVDEVGKRRKGAEAEMEVGVYWRTDLVVSLGRKEG